MSLSGAIVAASAIRKGLHRRRSVHRLQWSPQEAGRSGGTWQARQMQGRPHARGCLSGPTSSPGLQEAAHPIPRTGPCRACRRVEERHRVCLAVLVRRPSLRQACPVQTIPVKCPCGRGRRPVPMEIPGRWCAPACALPPPPSPGLAALVNRRLPGQDCGPSSPRAVRPTSGPTFPAASRRATAAAPPWGRAIPGSPSKRAPMAAHPGTLMP